MAELKRKERFVSLDVLRGLTVIGMILVNAQGMGRSFDFVRHSGWNGCTVADMVFPFFLFIVGASLKFALPQSSEGLPVGIIKKVLKRGGLIFLVGFVLHLFPFDQEMSSWRILGVLQRIALVYVGASFLVLWLKSAPKILGATLLLMTAYGVLLGTTGTSLKDNLVGVVDVFIFGKSHLYSGHGVGFDPEGLLSSVSAVASGLWGYLAAFLLVRARDRGQLPYLLGLLGGGLILLAYGVKEICPWNKSLWSSSFVLLTSGWAMLVWCVLFYVTDVKKRVAWTGFFLVFGTNALFTYVLSILFLKVNEMLRFHLGGSVYHLSTWLDTFVYQPCTMTPWRSLFWGMSVLFFCWAVTYPLYKKRLFIKL